MKKTALLAALFCAFYLSAFDGKVFCTTGVNVHDQWAHILPQRPPAVTGCTRVLHRQYFEIDALFRNAQKGPDGKGKVSGIIKITAPDGKTKFATPKQQFPCGTGAGVQLFPAYLKMCFDPPDAPGKYTITAELADEISGKTFSAQTQIILGENPAKTPDENVLKALNFYYRNRNEANLIPGLREFFAKLQEMREKQKKTNPLSTLGFFYFALLQNEQLAGEFGKFASSLANADDQMWAAVLGRELGGEFFKAMPVELQKKVSGKALHVFQVKAVTQVVQLDILWSEFFATGKFEPVRKIAETLPRMMNGMTLEKFKQIKKPQQQDIAALRDHLTGRAAMWSLQSNAKQHRLVAFYLEAMSVRKEIPDKTASAAVALILKNLNKDSEKSRAVPGKN